MKTVLINSAFALALAVAGAGSASAQPEVDVLGQRIPEDHLTVRVSFADLDLGAANDRSRLVTRVRGAVREVCAPFGQALQRIEQQNCRSYAWSGAKPQMDRAFAQAKMARLNGTAEATAVSIVVAAPAF